MSSVNLNNAVGNIMLHIGYTLNDLQDRIKTLDATAGKLLVSTPIDDDDSAAVPKNYVDTKISEAIQSLTESLNTLSGQISALQTNVDELNASHNMVFE